MTSLLDSTAHFSDRCLKLGLGQQFVTSLHRAGVDNLSRLAFAVGQLGQAIQNNDVEDFLQRTLGRASTLAEASSIKRMAFEAHTYLVATLRQQVDHTDDAQPRRVAFAERNQRMDQLKADLRGIDIRGEMEPAHALLDKACAIFENNSIKLMEPSVCISRSLEAQGATKSREFTLEKGALILKQEKGALIFDFEAGGQAPMCNRF